MSLRIVTMLALAAQGALAAEKLPPASAWIPQEAVVVAELSRPKALLDLALSPRVAAAVTASPAYRKQATQPGFQESFSSMFPAPRQRWVESMTVPDDEIRSLPHRTLIVHGREDQVIPLETSLKLLQLLDNADLSVFSHCGHWSMIERRDDFNRQVRDFFLGE